MSNSRLGWSALGSNLSKLKPEWDETSVVKTALLLSLISLLQGLCFASVGYYCPAKACGSASWTCSLSACLTQKGTLLLPVTSARFRASELPALIPSALLQALQGRLLSQKISQFLLKEGTVLPVCFHVHLGEALLCSHLPECDTGHRNV